MGIKFGDTKPGILDVSIEFEYEMHSGETLMLGLEKSTDRLYVFEWEVVNEGTPAEAGDWIAGRFLTFNGTKWVSNNTRPNPTFDTYEDICLYWSQNMVLHPMPSRGSKEYEDSILNGYISEMSEGMASLSHVG